MDFGCNLCEIIIIVKVFFFIKAKVKIKIYPDLNVVVVVVAIYIDVQLMNVFYIYRTKAAGKLCQKLEPRYILNHFLIGSLPYT